MRYRRSDIIERAVGILDQYGLADLSMRRIASELGLQPSALYHHFANKQELLAAVADELLRRGAGREVDGPWDQQVTALTGELRDAMLAYRDGAELVATVHAFGLGERTPLARVSESLRVGGFDESFTQAAAMTLLHFTFGHTLDEQTQMQAGSAGAIDGDPLAQVGSATFDLGVELILDGIRQRSTVEVSR